MKIKKLLLLLSLLSTNLNLLANRYEKPKPKSMLNIVGSTCVVGLAQSFLGVAFFGMSLPLLTTILMEKNGSKNSYGDFNIDHNRSIDKAVCYAAVTGGCLGVLSGLLFGRNHYKYQYQFSSYGYCDEALEDFNSLKEDLNLSKIETPQEALKFVEKYSYRGRFPLLTGHQVLLELVTECSNILKTIDLAIEVEGAKLEKTMKSHIHDIQNFKNELIRIINLIRSHPDYEMQLNKDKTMLELHNLFEVK